MACHCLKGSPSCVATRKRVPKGCPCVCFFLYRFAEFLRLAASAHVCMPMTIFCMVKWLHPAALLHYCRRVACLFLLHWTLGAAACLFVMLAMLVGRHTRALRQIKGDDS